MSPPRAAHRARTSARQDFNAKHGRGPIVMSEAERAAARNAAILAADCAAPPVTTIPAQYSNQAFDQHQARAAARCAAEHHGHAGYCCESWTATEAG